MIMKLKLERSYFGIELKAIIIIFGAVSNFYTL